MHWTRLKTASRAIVSEGPPYAFFYLFSWVYSAKMLRYKAACSPYPRVQNLLMRRSGLSFGRQVHLNFGVLVLGTQRNPPLLTLGNRVSVGPYVTFLTTSYPDASVLRTHPEMTGHIRMNGPIVVEDDVWIGAGVVVYPGIRIGMGAVLNAGTVVTRNVAPWTIVAGVPARPVRTMSQITGNPPPRSAEAGSPGPEPPIPSVTVS